MGYKMKVPTVAIRMREIAERIKSGFPNEAHELIELAGELRRRSGARAAATSTQMTPELAEEIREFSEANPTMSQQDIGVVFNVNHGRISEVLKGKRE
jgi:predicted XRE-type DNA-binding protein